ncbi:hypothetical protein pb186bvf_015955 [Paramecium bursaria]
MIDSNSVQIFICGATQMGKQVIEHLTQMLLSPDRDLKQAQEQIQLMEKNKLLIKELW